MERNTDALINALSEAINGFGRMEKKGRNVIFRQILKNYGIDPGFVIDGLGIPFDDELDFEPIDTTIMKWLDNITSDHYLDYRREVSYALLQRDLSRIAVKTMREDLAAFQAQLEKMDDNAIVSLNQGVSFTTLSRHSVEGTERRTGVPEGLANGITKIVQHMAQTRSKAKDYPEWVMEHLNDFHF